MTRVLEYDPDRQWLLATERIGDRTTSTVVARLVPLSVGLAIVAALEQARLVATSTAAGGARAEVEALPWAIYDTPTGNYRLHGAVWVRDVLAILDHRPDLAELGRLVDAI